MNLRRLRAEYLFTLGLFCGFTPDEVDGLTLGDFETYIKGVDSWLKLLPKLANPVLAGGR